MNKAIRHGEVVLTPVTEVPKGKTSKQTSFIVGHSETGHHHVLQGTEFEVTEISKNELYIRLFQPGKLVHQKQVDKHKTLPVSPGMYKISYKTEYSPWTKLISKVQD